MEQKEIKFQLEGLGFVFHSGKIMQEIEEGYDFLRNEFWENTKVANHAMKGDMIGLCTGSPGTYNLTIRLGNPEDDDSIMVSHPHRLRLGIEITDNYMYIRDLYELLEWHSECRDECKVWLENGFYEMKILTAIPESQIIGDNQELLIYLEKKKSMPSIEILGVPQFAYVRQ